MPYKSKKKASEATKLRMRRWRARLTPEQRRRRSKSYYKYKYKFCPRCQGNECEVCGYKEVLDNHHDGSNEEEHTLCPNCHALITRRKYTLAELFERKRVLLVDSITSEVKGV